MSQVSTGTVIIDSDYNIINYSEAVAALYPGLHKGAQCYKAFLVVGQVWLKIVRKV